MTSDTPAPRKAAARVPAAKAPARSTAGRERPVRRKPAPKLPIRPVEALHMGSGEPVLLLHGFMLSPHCWEQTATRLAARCEVYAPALAGHWGAKTSEGWSVDVAALTDRVEEQLDALGWRTCHIAGNSLGGWIGVELARRGRARTLTLIAPAGGWDTPSLAQMWVGLKFLSLTPLLGIGRQFADLAAHNPIAQRFAALWLSKSAAGVSAKDLAATITAALHCEAALPVILGGLRGSGVEDVSGLTTPVRLLLAEYDRVIPNRVYARRYLRELPDSADRILMHGVGHVPMLEAPDRIATLIAEHVYASRHRLRVV